MHCKIYKYIGIFRKVPFCTHTKDNTSWQDRQADIGAILPTLSTGKWLFCGMFTLSTVKKIGDYIVILGKG